MTVLSTAQAVAAACGLEIPGSVMASVDRDAVEMRAILAESAEAIQDAHDWGLLKTLLAIAGDGVTGDFALPADFRRFPLGQRLWSVGLDAPLSIITDHDEWLELTLDDAEAVIGYWTVLGGRIHTLPVRGVGEDCRIYYQSANAFASVGGAPKAAATADDDVFRLGERLLKLDMIWRWKASKTLPYAEDMANAERAMGEAIGRDRGPRILRVGRGAVVSGVVASYPKTITP